MNCSASFVLCVAWCGGILCLPAPAQTAELPTLTTVREVRQLTPDEAARGYPVRLRGVITYCSNGQPLRFLQDETGGTYFSGPGREVIGENREELEPGMEVEVDGVTVPGRFAPYVRRRTATPDSIRVLGRKALPPPRRVSIGELSDPQFHSDYIELSGVVRQVHHRVMDYAKTSVVWIKVGTNASSFTVQYFDPRGLDRLPPRFIGSQVTVRGVYGSTFNDRRQLVGFRLFVDPELGLTVGQPGPSDPLTELPLTPVSALMQFQGETRDYPMVRIGGTVTQIVPTRGFYVESQERGVWVEHEAEENPPRPGERVTVAGFPAFGPWNPILKDALFSRNGGSTLARPPLIDSAEAASGSFDCRLVTMRATLVEVFAGMEAPSALLQQAGGTFVVEWIRAEATTELRKLRPGALVEVTGTCLNKRPETRWAAFESGPYTALAPSNRVGFRLLAATPADVKELRAPDWWTPDRIWSALGGVALLALAFLGWNILLRRRVTSQTEIIRSQAAREAVQEDRTRIARELHDTLEQELTGIAVQLDAANDRLPESPPAAAVALTTARALLRHTRTEARRSVWDLRAALLEHGDLASALHGTARQLEGGAEIVFSVAGEPRRLPSVVENNLLRIGTEAMTNAVKHAAARRIEVEIVFSPDDLRLTVNDDGKGFDTSRASTLTGGHFGWLGMRERAGRIGAILVLESKPGAGTRVAAQIVNARMYAHSETSGDGRPDGHFPHGRET